MPISKRRAALAGVLTGLSGLAMSVLVASLLEERTNPLVYVAEAIIELTPGQVAEGLIQIVGQWDKPLLVTGVTLAFLGLSALAGLLHRRRQAYAAALFLLLGAASGAAALTRHQAEPVAILPVVVGVVTWLGVLPYLLKPDRSSAVTVEDGRRAFLVRAGIVGGAAVVFGVGGRYLGRARREVERARARLRLPVTQGAVPAGAEIAPTGVESWQVSNGRFYRIDTALTVPVIDPGDWRLRIHGDVENELTFTYQDLLDRQLTEAWVTICCVSNPVGGDLVGNAWWSGVRIAELLAEARPLTGADAVRQTSKDGWNCGTPLEALTDDRNALLAIAMNGQPLPLEHGFPVRMIVPGLYGFVSATKWVVDLEVTRFDKFDAYWTERGWSELGPVKTQSRVDVPRSGGSVRSGTVRVGGVAWAQHTGVVGVEVRLDGGEWQSARIGASAGDDSWVQWAGEIEVPEGEHTLAVRATDRSGYTQTGVRTDVVPDGATGWHTVQFTAH
jgi:DMSO/TMAO reductase YedYZ molybdopterin-dependent catalytic subunit